MRTGFSGPAVTITAVLMLLGCSNPENPLMNKTITLSAVPGVTAPVFGAAPVTSLDASQYTGAVS